MTVAKVSFFTSLKQQMVSLVVSFASPESQVQTRPVTTLDEEKIDLVRESDFLLHIQSVHDELQFARRPGTESC